MSAFVNLFTDIGFKIVFGQEASKDLLITLLNELFRGEHHVEDLYFLDKEDHADNANDRGIIYDLYCRTSSGEYIIVEMQNRWHSNFLDRTLYYVCRAISRQTEAPPAGLIPVNTGKDDLSVHESATLYGSRYRLKTVYGVFLMNFKEDSLEPKFRTDTVISDRETGRVINAHLRQIYLQFPYFTKELNDCVTLYDKLMYTLKNMNTWNRMPEALKEQVFQRLAQLAEVANLSEENRIAYDKAVDRYRVNCIVEEDERQARLEAIEKGKREGMMEGMREGKIEGMREGKIEGMREGKKEGIKEGKKESKIEIGLRMKAKGFSFADISDITGLSLEEIEKL